MCHLGNINNIKMLNAVIDQQFILIQSDIVAFLSYLHTVPSAPLNLTFPPGSVLNDSITITWIFPDYPNGIIQNYQLRWSSSGVEFFVNTADNTTVVLSDLNPGTQYNFSVRAFTVAFGPFSAQLTLHTADGEDMQLYL